MKEALMAILNNIAGVVAIFTLGLCAWLFWSWWRMGRALRQSCRFCREDGEECCPVVNRDGYRCTRAMGHKGRHVACGARRHRIAEWGGTVKAAQNVTDEGRGIPRPSPSDCSMGGDA